MKKIIGIALFIVAVMAISIIGYITNNKETPNTTNEEDQNILNNDIEIENKEIEEVKNQMKIRISNENHIIVFELNDSDAAKSLYEQLPLEVDVENFSSNEKIFYPSRELSTKNTPLANGGGLGVLAYYAPWGDVVMFYDTFRSSSGLYELGMASENAESIKDLKGKISITKE